MNKTWICLLLQSITLTAIAQDCNQATLIKALASKVPKDICIPPGYLIDDVYEPADIDGDGLEEYIFSWRRTSLNDGDTIFVSFYKNYDNKHFAHVKTLSNLFPIYFHRYSSSYKSYDTSLNHIFTRYNGWNPLRDLQITDNKIIIKIERSAGEGLIFTYRYNSTDWFLTQLREWEEDRDRNFTSKEIKATNLGSSIAKFNYFDYLY